MKVRPRTVSNCAGFFENDTSRMLLDDDESNPADDNFKRRIAVVETRLQHDYVAERDRWSPLLADDRERLGIELST